MATMTVNQPLKASGVRLPSNSKEKKVNVIKNTIVGREAVPSSSYIGDAEPGCTLRGEFANFKVTTAPNTASKTGILTLGGT